MLRKLKKAQTTAEYAILIGLVIGALVAMQTYVRRGLQGRIKDVVDHVGTGGDVGGVEFQFSGRQYEPYYLSSQRNTQQTSTNTRALQEGGVYSTNTTTQTQVSATETRGWEGYQGP